MVFMVLFLEATLRKIGPMNTGEVVTKCLFKASQCRKCSIQDKVDNIFFVHITHKTYTFRITKAQNNLGWKRSTRLLIATNLALPWFLTHQ